MCNFDSNKMNDFFYSSLFSTSCRPRGDEEDARGDAEPTAAFSSRPPRRKIQIDNLIVLHTCHHQGGKSKQSNSYIYPLRHHLIFYHIFYRVEKEKENLVVYRSSITSQMTALPSINKLGGSVFNKERMYETMSLFMNLRCCMVHW